MSDNPRRFLALFVFPVTLPILKRAAVLTSAILILSILGFLAAGAGLPQVAIVTGMLAIAAPLIAMLSILAQPVNEKKPELAAKDAPIANRAAGA